MQTLLATYGRAIERIDCSYVRYLHDRIAWDERLIGIKGARGVGKTTLILQHIKQNFPNRGKAFYVSLDNMWFSAHSLTELVDYLYTRGVEYFFFDEVHRYPTWIREIKNIYDSYPDVHIVFTGSSLLEIDNAEADLSRRLRMYHMHGLSFREYLNLVGVCQMQPVTMEMILVEHLMMASRITMKIKVLPFFETYIKSGYYPFFKEAADDVSYRQRVRKVIATAIDEDIPAVEEITYETLFKTKKLLTTLAQTVPFTPSITTLCETLSSTRNQVLKLMGLLERADLLRPLHCDSRKLKSVGKPDKILFNNTNLMSSMVDLADTGTMRESFLASAMCVDHEIQYPKAGDLLVDNRYIFEVGGRNKTFEQIADMENSFIAADDIETGFGNKIPLWMFGLLY